MYGACNDFVLSVHTKGLVRKIDEIILPSICYKSSGAAIKQNEMIYDNIIIIVTADY